MIKRWDVETLDERTSSDGRWVLFTDIEQREKGHAAEVEGLRAEIAEVNWRADQMLTANKSLDDNLAVMGAVLEGEIKRAHQAEAEVESLRADAERIEWMAHHGVSIRRDPADRRWFLVAPYHTGNPVIDNHEREDSARAAIDSARTATAQEGE